MWLILGAGLLLVITIKCLISRYRCSRLPVTVPGWLLVGNAWILDPKNLHFQLIQWAQEFGNVYTLWIYGEPIVVVQKFEHVVEIHERCHEHSLQKVHELALSGGILTGVSTDRKWKYIRKVSYLSLRSYGSLADTERLIQSEVEDFMQVLADTKGTPTDPQHPIRTMLCSVISTLMLGEKLGSNHPDIQRMLELSTSYDAILTIGFGMELNLFPWLSRFNIPSMNQINSYKKKRNDLLQKYINTVKKHTSKNNRGGLIHLLLNGGKENEQLNEEDIQATVADFLSAGIETTRVTVLVFMLQLLHHQQIMKNIQDEIDDVIGRSRSPEIEDKSKLPYLQAAIYETLRFACPVTVNLRVSQTDLEFHGYHIPKKTQIITNIWYVTHDPSFWKKPNEWKPERFLNSEGKLIQSSHGSMKRVSQVFGGGKRVCPGQKFAEIRLFLLAASLLQKFDLRPDPNNPPPSPSPDIVTTGGVADIVNFKICFKQRD